MSTKVSSDNPLLVELENKETQDMLLSLLGKLPELEKNLDSASNLVNFGQAILADEQTMNKYDSIARTYNLNEETITALIGLLEKLPSLLQMIEQLENLVGFITNILQDEKSLEYGNETIKDYLEPLNKKKEQGLNLWKEIEREVEKQNEPIKLLTILKWLRDPNVQTGLKYVQATLQILNTNKK